MELKGQSAVEYLMSYGWMILIALTAAGALYAVIGNQCTESVQGLSTTDVSINNFGLDSDQNLSLVVQNNVNREVEIVEYDVNISGNDAVFPASEVEGDTILQPTSSTEANLPSFKQGNECASIDIRIRYLDSTLGNQTITGTITTTIGEEFDVPEPPTDLNITEELAP